MICEGRILQKSEGRKTSIGVSMWKILDAMNYNRRLMIGKMIFLIKRILHH